jgi:hypothetical protein
MFLRISVSHTKTLKRSACSMDSRS